MPYRALRWQQLSLRNKLTLVNVALLTLGIVVAGIGTTLLLHPTLVGQLDAQLVSLAGDPVSVVGGDPATERFGYENVLQTPQPYYVALIDDNGQVLVDNWGQRPRAIAPTLSASDLAAFERDDSPDASARYSVFEIHDGLGSSWRAVAVDEDDYRNDQVRGTLVIAVPMSTVNATMASFLAIFFGFGLSVVIFGAALTRVLVSATLQPLRSVESTAMSFAAGDYDQRLPVAAPDTEVGRLSRSLNTMLSRIDAALEERQDTIARMRRFVGDASHELRTPLVTVRGYAELYRMGALDESAKVGQAMDRIEKEALRMTGLVEDLLQLARLDETKELVKEIIDLEPIAEDAAMDARAQSPARPIRALPVRLLIDGTAQLAKAPQPQDDPDAAGAANVRRRWIPNLQRSGRTLWSRRRPPAAVGDTAASESEQSDVLADAPVTELDLPAMVLGNEDKIRQAVSNIIGNALRYTPEGTPIEVGVVLDPAARTATVEIIDHGEGIPPQIRQKIFERFWRADTSRARETGGSGLGLAIVSAIMRAHDGQVEVVGTPGGGATFRLQFPLLVAEDVDDSPDTAAQAGAAPGGTDS